MVVVYVFTDVVDERPPVNARKELEIAQAILFLGTGREEPRCGFAEVDDVGDSGLTVIAGRLGLVLGSGIEPAGFEGMGDHCFKGEWFEGNLGGAEARGRGSLVAGHLVDRGFNVRFKFEAALGSQGFEVVGERHLQGCQFLFVSVVLCSLVREFRKLSWLS